MVPVTWHNAYIGARVIIEKRGLRFRGKLVKLGRRNVVVELDREGLRGSHMSIGLVKRPYNEVFFDKE
jgi:hypothetical protein